MWRGLIGNFFSRRYKGFEAKNLSKVSRIWQYFVYSRLMPITHYSIVDWEWAILLSVIISTKNTYVEEIINQQTRLFANNHHFIYFFFKLVTALCAKTGIRFSKVNFWYNPMNYWLQHTWANSLLGWKESKGTKRLTLLQKLQWKKNFNS